MWCDFMCVCVLGGGEVGPKIIIAQNGLQHLLVLEFLKSGKFCKWVHSSNRTLRHNDQIVAPLFETARLIAHDADSCILEKKNASKLSSLSI